MSSLRAILLLTLLAGTAHAADKGRSSQHVGVLFGYSATAPSQAGLEIQITPVPFLKFSFGAGMTVRDGEATGLTAATNALFTAMAYILTAGRVPFQDLYHFLYGKNQGSIQSLISYGLGLNFVVPKWTLSPLVGVHYAKIETSNSMYGLAPREDHVYYRAGLDLQTNVGFALGAGVNYSPKMPTQLRLQPYVQLGWFF